MCIYVFVMCIYIYICICIYIYICAVCVCVHVCMYVYIYILHCETCPFSLHEKLPHFLIHPTRFNLPNSPTPRLRLPCQLWSLMQHWCRLDPTVNPSFNIQKGMWESPLTACSQFWSARRFDFFRLLCKSGHRSQDALMCAETSVCCERVSICLTPCLFVWHASFLESSEPVSLFLKPLRLKSGEWSSARHF